MSQGASPRPVDEKGAPSPRRVEEKAVRTWYTVANDSQRYDYLGNQSPTNNPALFPRGREMGKAESLGIESEGSMLRSGSILPSIFDRRRLLSLANPRARAPR